MNTARNTAGERARGSARPDTPLIVALLMITAILLLLASIRDGLALIGAW